MDQQTMIASWLRVFVPPGQVTELRALGVGDRRAVSFCSNDIEAVAGKAVELDRAGARGCYFTPNPLRPDLSGGHASARKVDVVERRWLLIDVDPIRPADSPSSDPEREAAWAVIDRCRGTMEAVGLTGAVVGDSGNGFHLCYPVLLPNDDNAQELLKAILQGLQKRCGDEQAQVDVKNFDAPRIWKLYGTQARKGDSTSDRPHRYARLVEGSAWEMATAQRNAELLPQALERWKAADDLRRGRPAGDIVSRARAYIAKEPPAISGQHGHDRCYHVACVLVQGFGLSEAQALEAIQDWNRTCRPPWSDVELRHKIADAWKAPGPRGTMVNGTNGNGKHSLPNSDTSDDPLDRDATAADLIEANVTIRWGWDKWLPAGVLCVLASEPGVGKTRYCADLARRVYLGLPWPDGALPTFPAGSRTLWVPADNQHAELGSLPKEYGFPPESLYLNATRRNPFGGTLLDADEDLKDFERRIHRVKPALVFVDTSLNATDKSAHKPEDAKAFFVPLQQIAARTGVVMLCVTHLNAAGKPLGRRIMGQARLVMQLEQPDPDGQPNRRKLYVVKSNSLFPAPLGVTMGTGGNEYDTSPPEAGSSRSRADTPSLQKAREWLASALHDGPQRVGATRKSAEAAGISARDLYRARDSMGVEEFEVQERKWWRLAPSDPPE